MLNPRATLSAVNSVCWKLSRAERRGVGGGVGEKGGQGWMELSHIESNHSPHF